MGRLLFPASIKQSAGAMMGCLHQLTDAPDSLTTVFTLAASRRNARKNAVRSFPVTVGFDNNSRAKPLTLLDERAPRLCKLQ